MRWPFVSRADYDAVIASARQQGDNAYVYQESLIAQINAERARYDALLEKYHALKVQGAAEVQPLPERAKREPDPCVQAINERCNGNAQLRMAMLAQLRRDRNAGVDETDILARIESGEATFLDGVPA